MIWGGRGGVRERNRQRLGGILLSPCICRRYVFVWDIY